MEAPIRPHSWTIDGSQVLQQPTATECYILRLSSRVLPKWNVEGTKSMGHNKIQLGHTQMELADSVSKKSVHKKDPIQLMAQGQTQMLVSAELNCK